MACSFEYNGVWYTEAELKDLYDKDFGQSLMDKDSFQSRIPRIEVAESEGQEFTIDNLVYFHEQSTVYNQAPGTEGSTAAPNTYLVWHGSETDIKEFKADFPEGFFHQSKGGSPKAIFFSKDKAPADSVYGKRPYQKQFQVTMNNPLIVNYSDPKENVGGRNREQWVKKAIDEGYDGLIWKNIHDNFVTDVYISFDPKNVKEATAETSSKTLVLVNKFLERIGVTKSALPQYDLAGKKIDANGQANLLNDIIKIAQGKENVALTEEAMHFAVAIIKQTNPQLFKQMMNKIGTFNYYKQIYNEYSKRYVNKDGTPDILKIKEEAIGKILAEYLINDTEGSTEKPELLAQTLSWWQQIKDFFLALIGKATFNPFQEAIKEMDKIEDTSALDKPYKELVDRIMSHPLQGIYGMAATNAYKQGRYRGVVTMFSEQLEDPETYQTIVDSYLEGDEALAQEILKAGEGFLQTAPSAPDNLFDKIKQKIKDYQLVKKQDNADPDDENNNSYYEVVINGKPERADRTTEWAKRENISRNGGKDYFAGATKEQLRTWAKKAMSGTNGHLALETIIKANLTPEGLLKPKSEWTIPPSKLVNRGVYESLAKFLLGYNQPATGDKVPGFLEQFPEGSRFGVEEMLYNEKANRASTLDLIVQLPDGSVKVYDWKFMGFSLDNNIDQPFQKRRQHALQLGDYKKSLKESYGVTKVDAYTVPIHAIYGEQIVNGEQSPVLYSVTIGKVNVKDETRTYLLPVVPEGQSSGNPEVDKLVASLEAHYKRLYSRKEGSTYEEKMRALNHLSAAIRNLQVAMNFEPLKAETLEFKKNADRLLDKYDNVDFKSLTNKVFNEQLNEILETYNSANTYSSIDEVFSSIYKGTELSKKNQETLDFLRGASASTKEIKQKALNILQDYITYMATEEGVDNILSPTKEIQGSLNNMIENGSILLPMANLATQRAMDYASFNKQKEAKKIQEFGEIYSALKKLAGSKNPFDLIAKGTELFHKTKKEFWVALKDAKENQNKEFILDNVNKEQLIKDIEEEYKRQEAIINDRIYSSNEKENEAKRKNALVSLRRSLDIGAKDFNGWYDYSFSKIVKKNIIEEPHFTLEYKAIYDAKGPALAMHSFIFELNREGFATGYLAKGNNMSFLPLITGTILERLTQGGSVKNILQDAYKIDAAQQHLYSPIDPETGEREKNIPKIFTRTNREEKELSKDLLKIIPAYIQVLQEYETAKILEVELLAMKAIEAAKGHLESDGSGVIADAEGPKVFEGNQKNTRIIDEMTDWLVYGNRESNNTLFDQAASKVIKGTEEEKRDKTVSAKKLVQNGNAWTQGLAVGLKLLVALPNYFGAHFQAAVNSGLHYSFKDFLANHHKIIGSMLIGTGADIDKGLIDLVVPLNDNIVKEGQRKIAGKQSPQKWLSTWTFQEFLMSTNQWPDKAHQLTNAKSFNDNSMVVDGKIVSIKKHLLSLPEYKGRYTSGNLKQIEKELGAKIKELKESSSLPKIAKFNDKGILEIPGVSEEELAKYRTRVVEYGRKITGQMSNENFAGYRKDILVKSFMMFKNWIPKQVSLRTLDIKKNVSLDQWEYGRTRLFLKTWQHLGALNLLKMRQIISATPEGIQIMKEMVDQKREEYFKKTGLELTITDEEFYDMVRKELSAQAKELVILFSLMGTVLAAKLAAPPDDDDPLAKNRYRFLAKAINKISDEMAFYYNPLSAESITRGSLFPALGILTKAEKIIQTAGTDLYGYSMDDEDMMKKAHTLKYLFNLTPVASQFQNELFPIVDPEGAKEWGIITSSQARAMR